MKLTILGSGTSHGVPVIGCDCAVCTSRDLKNSRLRCSAILTTESGRNFLIDVGPDFRQQALNFGLKKLEGVFLTHPHADHVHGIDDLRIFSHKNSLAMNEDKTLAQRYPETQGKGLPIYLSSNSKRLVQENFHYIFIEHKMGGGTPKLDLESVDDFNADKMLELETIKVVPIPLLHGRMETTGWVFIENTNEKKHCIAYLTDCNYISELSIERIKNAVKGGILDHLVIDALRAQEHSSHNSFDKALFYADKIGAEHTWFTHMSHDFLHEDIQKYIDEHLNCYENLSAIVWRGGSVCPSYDGLEILCR